MLGLSKRDNQMQVGINAADAFWSLACLSHDGDGKLQGELHSVMAEQESLEKGLFQWVHHHKLQKSPCFVVLPEGSYQLLLVEKPVVEEMEVRQALGWQLKDRLPKSVEDYAIDYFPIPPNIGMQEKPMVFAVIVEKEKIRRITDIIHSAGLNLQKIDIAELAIRCVLFKQEQVSQGIGYLSLQGHEGNLHFYKEGLLCFSRKFDLVFSIEGEMDVDQLGLEVQRSMDYYERQMRQVVPNTLLCCGETVNPEIRLQLKKRVGANIIAAEVGQWIDLSPCVSEENNDLSIKDVVALSAAMMSPEKVM